MENVYSTVLRAPGEAQLLGTKLWVYSHPINLLYKTGSNYLNSATEHPSRLFPIAKPFQNVSSVAVCVETI